MLAGKIIELLEDRQVWACEAYLSDYEFMVVLDDDLKKEITELVNAENINK